MMISDIYRIWLEENIMTYKVSRVMALTIAMALTRATALTRVMAIGTKRMRDWILIMRLLEILP
jgi:hypothetical protein